MFQEVRLKLHTAVVGDLLDGQGFFHQFLSPHIQPLHHDMIVLGRAMPVLEQDFADPGAGAVNSEPVQPFGLMLEALDDLKRGEVYFCTGSSPTYATWGELMSTRAIQLRAAGAVLDGYSRDTRGIIKLGFPTFSRGRYAQDQRPRGHVVDFRIPVKSGNVVVNPGDIVFGDLDGVVVIPRQVERDIFRLAFEKVDKERVIQKAFEEEGTSARDAFAKYGVM
jgi:regulator of RNase E activity RraA